MAVKKTYKCISTWLNFPNNEIANAAKGQNSLDNAPTPEVVKVVMKNYGVSEQDKLNLPPINQRCKSLGAWWEFAYDSQYRFLSALQHGDMTRASLLALTDLKVSHKSDEVLYHTMSALFSSARMLLACGLKLAQEAKDTTAQARFSSDIKKCEFLTAQILENAISHLHGPKSKSNHENTEE